MNDFYVVKNEETEGYVSSIYRTGASTTPNYFDALALTTQAMAAQFKAYCEGVNTGVEYGVYHVQVSVTEVTISKA